MGKLLKEIGLTIDLISKTILHDWNRGKIPYYNLPPEE